MSKDFELEAEDSGPTIGDRVNYSWIVGRALLSFILNETRAGDYDEYAVTSAAQTVRSLIPSSMEDDDFREAVKNATYVEIQDNREIWCGIPCGKLNDSNSKRNIRYDPHKLLRACVDLLKRNNLLSKSVPMEKLDKALGHDKPLALGENIE